MGRGIAELPAESDRRYQQPGRLATLHSTNAISPTTFNEASFAISQNTLTYEPLDPTLIDRSKLGITLGQRNPSLNVLNAIPNMTFGGIPNSANPSMSDGTPYFNQNTIYSFTDNVSKVRDTHTFKAGVYYERTGRRSRAPTPPRAARSASITDGNNPFDANNAYGNALLGNYDNYTEATGRPQGDWRYTNLEAFVQDTWRMRRNFSLDYGVRFYHDPPQYDERSQLSSFSTAAYQASNAPVLLRPAKVNGTNVAHQSRDGPDLFERTGRHVRARLWRPRERHAERRQERRPGGPVHAAAVSVAPRLGFAWDPFGTGKTAIRGGGGVYFDRIQGNPVMGLLGPPVFFSPVNYYGSYSRHRGDCGLRAALADRDGLLAGLEGHQQVVYSFNLEIQRQIGRSDALKVGYTGSLGQHLLWQRNINPVPLGASFLSVNPQNREPAKHVSALLGELPASLPGLGR